MIDYLNSEDARAVLNAQSFGHIGCNDGFNTYIYPTNYVFEDNCIYCHSMPGAKISTMRINDRVCLQVDEIQGAETWKSVMVHGRYQEVEDVRERYRAIRAFTEHGMHLKVSSDAVLTHSFMPHPQSQQQNMSRVIYRIRIEEIVGRCELR